MDNRLYLFSDLGEIIKKEEENRIWLNRFFRLPSIWQNKTYLTTCLINGNASHSSSELIAIFAKRIKQFHREFCLESKALTEEELRIVLTIMIAYGIFLTKENLLNTLRHFRQGFYREYVTEVEEQIAKDSEQEQIQKLVQSIDWGDF